MVSVTANKQQSYSLFDLRKEKTHKILIRPKVGYGHRNPITGRVVNTSISQYGELLDGKDKNTHRIPTPYPSNVVLKPEQNNIICDDHAENLRNMDPKCQESSNDLNKNGLNECNIKDPHFPKSINVLSPKNRLVKLGRSGIVHNLSSNKSCGFKVSTGKVTTNKVINEQTTVIYSKEKPALLEIKDCWNYNIVRFI